MNTIQALIEAWEATQKKGVRADFYQRNIDCRKALDNAMPEIVELVGLNRKVFARGHTVSEDDINRIREIVGEG